MTMRRVTKTCRVAQIREWRQQNDVQTQAAIIAAMKENVQVDLKLELELELELADEGSGNVGSL